MTGVICGPSAMHPYECNGPGECVHCDRRVTEIHDPATCALCDREYDGGPPIDRSPARRCDGTKFCAALEHAPDCRGAGVTVDRSPARPGLSEPGRQPRASGPGLGGADPGSLSSPARPEDALIERLRSHARDRYNQYHLLTQEAADVLAVLLAEREERGLSLHAMTVQRDAFRAEADARLRENEAAEAELETLRAALRAIADPQSWKLGDPTPGERARAALAGSTNG